MPDYSKIINDLRSKRGMTLQEIADKVGVDIKSIGNYQKGVVPRDKNVRAKLVELWNTGDVSMTGSEPEADYKVKVIELQEKLLENNKKSASEIEAEIGNYKIKVKDRGAYLLNSLSALEVKVNVLSDLLIYHMTDGNKDARKADRLMKVMSESDVKELKATLEKYRTLGLIDF